MTRLGVLRRRLPLWLRDAAEMALGLVVFVALCAGCATVYCAAADPDLNVARCGVDAQP